MLKVTLVHWPHQDGRFFLRFNVPTDFERQRPARLALALEEKCSKPTEARQAAAGATSLLVLETADNALGNEIEIAQIVNDELGGRADVPDHVYVVDTAAEPWAWLVAKEGAAGFPNDPDAGPRFFARRA